MTLRAATSTPNIMSLRRVTMPFRPGVEQPDRQAADVAEETKLGRLIGAVALAGERGFDRARGIGDDPLAARDTHELVLVLLNALVRGTGDPGHGRGDEGEGDDGEKCGDDASPVGYVVCGAHGPTVGRASHGSVTVGSRPSNGCRVAVRRTGW